MQINLESLWLVLYSSHKVKNCLRMLDLSRHANFCCRRHTSPANINNIHVMPP